MTDQPPARSYAVLLAKPEAFDIPKIGEALGQFFHIPFAEAAGMARKSWGIISESLEKEPAEALAGLLQKSGIPALSIPKNLIEDLPVLSTAAKLEWEADGLKAALKTGGERKIKSESISLIAACAFKKTITIQAKAAEGADPAKRALGLGLMLMTGLPNSIGGKKKEKIEVRQQTELVCFLDLYFKDAARLRVDAQDFDYSGLKKDMGYAALENFRMVVERLVKGAPQAGINKGADTLVRRQPIHAMGYDALADLEKEARWLLTLKSLAKA